VSLLALTASAQRRVDPALRTLFRRDLIRDRTEHPTDRLNRPDARTVKVRVSPVVRDGVQGVMATARRASGAIIGRAAEIDATTGQLVRFIGNWGFVGRFGPRPGEPQTALRARTIKK
jgi:hypothetical protein